MEAKNRKNDEKQRDQKYAVFLEGQRDALG